MTDYKRTNIILGLIALALLITCIVSIAQPIRFADERRKREMAVERQLVRIRRAQDIYKARHGDYCPTLDSLIKLRLLSQKDKYVPYAKGETFIMATTTTLSKAGKVISLMECGATYKMYLKGLDENEISSITQTAEAAGQYAGLKIGDINMPNNNAGNWE